MNDEERALRHDGGELAIAIDAGDTGFTAASGNGGPGQCVVIVD